MTSRTKIGLDGRAYDSAATARVAVTYIRSFVAQAVANHQTNHHSAVLLMEGLNAICDRLQTCDALDMVIARHPEEIDRLRRAHGVLIKAAVLLSSEYRRDPGASRMKVDELVEGIEDALTGINGATLP